MILRICLRFTTIAMLLLLLESIVAAMAASNTVPVSGLDESGHASAMGLGWIVMAPEGDQPLILQKAGGLQGVFTYTAFAPTRGVGVFVAISQFNFAAAMAMAKVANELIGTLAPR